MDRQARKLAAGQKDNERWDTQNKQTHSNDGDEWISCKLWQCKTRYKVEKIAVANILPTKMTYGIN